MNFKQLYTSTKTYIVLLVIAVMLLLVTTSMTYRQIMLTQKSAERVVHTLQVYNALSDLTNHYNKAKTEEFREELLKNKDSNNGFIAYKQEGQSIIDTLSLLIQDNDLQKARIKPLTALLNNLHSQLLNLDVVNEQDSLDAAEIKQSQKLKINRTLDDIGSIKNRMLTDEKRLLNERKLTYTFHKSLTPNMLLILAFFALLVFVISFFRIYNNKLKIRKSEAFLKNVLATTDNIVNYYEPIYGITNEIIDFKIIYANDCNRDYLGLEPDKIMGDTVLNVYPLHKSHSELQELITSFKKKTKVVFDRKISIDGKTMWFKLLVTSLAEGVLVTCRNATADEESKEMESALKKRLEHQNLTLLDNRALLTNIFKSISHIVMHFKSIRNKDGKIVDFEVLFVNDKISPLTGDIPDDIKNKKISEVFPSTFNSGVFEHMVNAIENDKAVEYEVPYNNKNGSVQWFKATAIKLGDGVTITTRDVTGDKEKANQLVNLNEVLIIQNSILTGAERIAKIGNFIWYLDTGISEISDNFYQMLGYQPKEFEPSFEKYREFIHPEDLNEYDKIGKKALTELQVSEHTYRILTKQGTIRHFKTNGQFINKNDKLVMIGVVQDVTETIEAEAMLLKSNLELKSRNDELESFNRVASHDLQEPLRKIQLFALRIQDTEAENFTEKSKDYFGKVIKAVNRMQSLIENLLAYSKINITKKDFEKVDLNHVLAKVKEDLTTNISNSSTEIISDNLPKIMGVTFQMEQLFTNLISNAIKYKRTDETPRIQIQYIKVSATELPDSVQKEHKQYHKITFIDNGIGFKQQYAEKIFEVFQRLHQKTEYSGTGIGLAICKKIVENHNGYIVAQGTENVSAQFIVYLPV
ncbi:PAS domain S-box-containing protein [Mariniflexile fucanivorans]|uniref:histidine kinase n=1 Tax=Mariniflexile fucanivorans TaxID=264023 RepID=A0A4R1RN22_9FLAO|nr:PAS domain-containing protein [Mariniflexile fucanivorans]TCL67604.1 PAS domain S-box-containing protein [Mariniflexile fucanivorans]